MLVAVRCALHLVSIERLRRRPAISATQIGLRTPIIWSVRTAARRVPGTTCSFLGPGAQRLLSSAGHPSQVHIGVARDALASRPTLSTMESW